MTPASVIPNDCSNHTYRTRQVQAQRARATRLAWLYRRAKSATRAGMARGVDADGVLGAVAQWAFCSRGAIQLLDAWEVTLEAVRAARDERRAAA